MLRELLSIYMKRDYLQYFIILTLLKTNIKLNDMLLLSIYEWEKKIQSLLKCDKYLKTEILFNIKF